MQLNTRAERLSELLRSELEARRVAAGLSKSELAAKAGLAVSFVSYLESGKRRPTVESLAKLAWVLGTTPGEMLCGCESRLPK
ncbi:helix-turn-helix transcriptional regulator [Luteolibacter sp. LG18]|uniref:helix-turn-helix domain-containing protein n=1 Tax=Luteolibacter sp. LG18 TaxID=2819286 RepID=UPI002B31E608|nr:hypothetical protein llg_05510 [Luteolibacter sp. LG18]